MQKRQAATKWDARCNTAGPLLSQVFESTADFPSATQANMICSDPGLSSRQRQESEDQKIAVFPDLLDSTFIIRKKVGSKQLGLNEA